MKTKKMIYFGMMVALVGITSCSKEKSQTVADQPEDARMTLAEFTEARETSAERNFLSSAEIIDNNEILERYRQEDREEVSIIWKPTQADFRWDCLHCFGSCEVKDPSPFPEDPLAFPFAWASLEVNAISGVVNAGAAGLKLQLYPSPDELSCAFTADGFFPIYENIYLNTAFCDMMGLAHGSYIESGVYAANYDATAGAYTSVLVNIEL